jgi:peptidyl-prolyl cis-trans isomerase D
MLQAIRKGTGSWITKGFLLVIVLSFAVWGVGDIIRGPRDTTVITVGSRDISASEFNREFQVDMRLLQARLSTVIPPEDVRRYGIVDATVRRFVDRSLLDQAVGDLGLAVADAVVEARTVSNPAFQNALGRFDRRIFESTIQTRGMNEQMYFAASRGDIAREMLIASIADGGAIPEALTQKVYAYRQERRAAEIIVIPHDAMGEVEAPDEGTLEAFHQENAVRFTAPEYRSLTYLTLAPKDLADEVSISDDELAEEYELRLDEYVTLARRDLDQIVLGDEAAARAAHQRIAGGADFAQVAAEVADLSAEDLALGVVTQEDLPTGAGEKVFALPLNGLSEPLESAFGWHLFWVKGVVEGGTRSLDEVRDELTRALKLERAADAMFELANELQDALAGGTTLEEAAVQLGLDLKRLEAVDAVGTDAFGAPIAELLEAAGLLSAAFQGEVGIESDLVETEKGSYFIVRVDKITEPALRPLEDVRADVIAAWQAAQRAEAARAKADETADKVRGGAELSAVAAELGYETRTTPGLTRAESQGDPAISSVVLAELFALSPGEVATGTTALGNAQVVARLKTVETPNASADALALRRITEELRQGLAGDVLAQYRDALEAAYSVEINDIAIDSALGLGPS